jgi:hypothetical protein
MLSDAGVESKIAESESSRSSAKMQRTCCTAIIPMVRPTVFVRTLRPVVAVRQSARIQDTLGD